MKVTKSADSTTPTYPSRRQFQKSRAMMGAAAIGLGALAAGCTSRTPYPEEPITVSTPLGGEMAMEPRVESVDYIVHPGDTLFKIAKANLGKGSRWRDIVALNTGLTPTNLKAGQTIRIPATAQ